MQEVTNPFSSKGKGYEENHKFICVICGAKKPFHTFGVLTDWGDCCNSCLREALRRYILKLRKFHKGGFIDAGTAVRDNEAIL